MFAIKCHIIIIMRIIFILKFILIIFFATSKSFSYEKYDECNIFFNKVNEISKTKPQFDNSPIVKKKYFGIRFKYLKDNTYPIIHKASLSKKMI